MFLVFTKEILSCHVYFFKYSFEQTPANIFIGVHWNNSGSTIKMAIIAMTPFLADSLKTFLF